MTRYLKLLKSDMTGGWSSVQWPEQGDFQRRTTREPVCGKSGIWLIDSAYAAINWMKIHNEGYCKVALVESGDPNPVLLTDNGRKVGVRSARVIKVVSFTELVKELDAVYAKWQPELDAASAKWRTEQDAVDAKIQRLFDGLLNSEGTNE